MDRLNRKILDILTQNGRKAYTEIAENLDVSEGTVRNRVEKLQEEGIIRRFTVEVQERGVSALVMTQVSTSVDVETVIDQLPSEVEVKEVTGDYDLVLEFSREGNREMNSTLDSIRNIRGVDETKTYSVLKSRQT